MVLSGELDDVKCLCVCVCFYTCAFHVIVTSEGVLTKRTSSPAQKRNEINPVNIRARVFGRENNDV